MQKAASIARVARATNTPALASPGRVLLVAVRQKSAVAADSLRRCVVCVCVRRAAMRAGLGAPPLRRRRHSAP
jgi:hypothetical protein